MKQIHLWPLVAFLAASLAIAQSGGSQDPAQDHPHAAHTQHHPPGDHHPMGGMADHEQMMRQMQASLDGMKANLQKMKDGIAGVNDQATRDQLQLNIDLWQACIDNMDHHMHMMGMMMEHGPMHRGKGMEHHHAPDKTKPEEPKK
jgi:hypothetical protein